MVEKEEMPIGTDTFFSNLFFRIKCLTRQMERLQSIAKPLHRNGYAGVSFLAPQSKTNAHLLDAVGKRLRH